MSPRSYVPKLRWHKLKRPDMSVFSPENTELTHAVYSIVARDERGKIGHVYVGMTAEPEVRWKSHSRAIEKARVMPSRLAMYDILAQYHPARIRCEVAAVGLTQRQAAALESYIIQTMWLALGPRCLNTSKTPRLKLVRFRP